MHHISDKTEVYDQQHSIDIDERSRKPSWPHRRTRWKYRGNKKAGRMAMAPSIALRTGGNSFRHSSSNLETGTQRSTRRRTASRRRRATRSMRGRRATRSRRREDIPTSTKMSRETRGRTTGGRPRRGARAPPAVGQAAASPRIPLRIEGVRVSNFIFIIFLPVYLERQARLSFRISGGDSFVRHNSLQSGHIVLVG